MKNPVNRRTMNIEKPSITGILRPLHGKSASAVESTADGYLRYFDQETQRTDDGADDSDAEAVERRRKDALAVTNAYYDLATDFYEYGWGDAFHFAVLKPEESREHSFAKHEYYLAMKLGLKAGDTVLVGRTSFIGRYVVCGLEMSGNIFFNPVLSHFQWNSHSHSQSQI